MSTASHRLACCGLLLLCMSLALAGACYETPPMAGYYACAEDADCGAGLVCDDGVCCSELGTPLCLGRVLDGGMCADGGTATQYFRDEDDDGYGNSAQPLLRCATPESLRVSLNPDDCNDNPASGGNLFFPGSPEQCDGLDNDCDGQLDEGFDGGTYYRDEDSDGFGDTNQPVSLCLASPGYVVVPDDCQPRNARAYPHAQEECNGLDDDCDTYIDEELPAKSWYRDMDNDGFGRASMERQACAQPESFVSNPDDCDDTNAANNPDALDVCDKVDNDCNLEVDERPDCGGPEDLLDLSATGERGAIDTRANFNGQNPSCLRGWEGGLPESFSANNVWSGSRPSSHAAWFEAPGTWDLTRADNSLRIRFGHRIAGNGSPTWSPHRQPVIVLCSEGGFARYVPFMDGGVNPLLHSAGVEVNTVLPIGRGTAGGWIERSTALDLKRVKRVEILVEPSDAGSPNVSFDINFLQLGFQ